MQHFLTELKRRNVFRLGVIYLGAAWIVAQVAGLVGQWFALAPWTLQVVLILLAAGFPIALLLAWLFERTPEGLRPYKRGEARAASHRAARNLDHMLAIVLGVVILSLMAERLLAPRPILSNVVTLAVLGVAFIGLMIERFVLNKSALDESGVAEPKVSSREKTAVKPAVKPRIAILPFENMSPDPANAFFADGLHEELLSTLAARARDMDVISRTTMMLQRRDPRPLVEMAQSLNATHVLESSVRREGDTVRLTVQLIDGRTDHHLWAQSYTRTLSGALTLQAEVAAEVAQQLAVRLTDTKRSNQAATTDPEAYDLYLKARVIRQNMLPQPGAIVTVYDQAYRSLSEAIERDPNFVLAYAERAILSLEMFTDYDQRAAVEQLARDDLAAAKRLDPTEPAVLGTDAVYRFVVEHDFEGALASLEAARAAGLTDPAIVDWHGVILRQLGRREEAASIAQELSRLDPANVLRHSYWLQMLWETRRFGDAVRLLDRIMQRFPNNPLMITGRSVFLLSFTGRTDFVRRALAGAPADESAWLVEMQFVCHRFEGRFSELWTYLEGVKLDALRMSQTPTEPQPVAALRGWAAMFLKDRARAAEQGRKVLDFVASREETKYNRWFLRLLAGYGHTFLGEKSDAIAGAREALKLMPRSLDFQKGDNVALHTAAVLAWNGAEDEAVDLLEELATSKSVYGPGSFSGDPFFTIPLADNARYRAFFRRCKDEIREINRQIAPMLAAAEQG
jgi:TolB-like protein